MSRAYLSLTRPAGFDSRPRSGQGLTAHSISATFKVGLSRTCAVRRKNKGRVVFQSIQNFDGLENNPALVFARQLATFRQAAGAQVGSQAPYFLHMPLPHTPSSQSQSTSQA